MENRERIIKAILNKDITALTEHLHEGVIKSKNLYLKEIYEVFTKQDSISYWNVIKDSYFDRIFSFCEKLSNQLNSGDKKSTTSFQDNLELLKALSNGILEYSQASKFIPGALFDILNLIQSLLVSSYSDNSMLVTIKSIISKISEYWWMNELEGAENLMPNLITYLMLVSLDINGHDVDIKRLYPLRGAFLLLDFEDPSINFINNLINRCYVHPGFLKVVDGQKFLAFLLNLNRGLLISSISQIIRAQLTVCIDAVAVSYGQIYYRAWKDSVATDADIEKQSNLSDNEGSTVQLLLEDSIQTLLRECIHAAESKYFKGLRTLLKSFHDIKRSDELNGMLLRVYDPILWRALRCANAQVRSQASMVFLDVFPLQHADGRAEEDDKILQKQFDLLSTLLKDNDHKVRANAVLGVCNILKEYWEVLPVNTTHNILKYIIDTLSVDSSSADVRYSLFLGIGVLFQQPLAHTLLKQLLPFLKTSIHDKSEKVRIAFIKILCQIKGIRGIHFYEIVEVNHLLERLAEDRNRPNVCKVMTELLLNSFYPQNQNSVSGELETEQLLRCTQFIEKNPRAAEAFYSNLHHFIPIGYVAKLITMIFTILISASGNNKNITNPNSNASTDNKKIKGKRGRTASNENDLKNSTSECLEFSVKIGLSQVLLCILESVSDQFFIQQPARELVCKYLTKDRLDAFIRDCTILHSSTQVNYLLPIAFKISAVGHMLLQMNTANDTKKSKESSKIKDLIINTYYPAWSNVVYCISENNETSEKSENMKSALASSLMKIAKCSNSEVDVLYCILESLQQLNKDNQNMAISFGAAIDLLLAYEDSAASESVEADESEEAFNVFEEIISNLKEIFECELKSKGHEDDSCSSQYLAKAMKVWISRHLRIDASFIVLNGYSSKDEKFANMRLIMSWFDSNVIKNCIIQSNKSKPCSSAMMYFDILLATITDLFYINLEDSHICNMLHNWFRSLRIQGMQNKASYDVLVSKILPIVLRLSKILNLTNAVVDGNSESPLHVEILNIIKPSLVAEMVNDTYKKSVESIPISGKNEQVFKNSTNSTELVVENIENTDKNTQNGSINQSNNEQAALNVVF